MQLVGRCPIWKGRGSTSAEYFAPAHINNRCEGITTRRLPATPNMILLRSSPEENAVARKSPFCLPRHLLWCCWRLTLNKLACAILGVLIPCIIFGSGNGFFESQKKPFYTVLPGFSHDLHHEVLFSLCGANHLLCYQKAHLCPVAIPTNLW